MNMFGKVLVVVVFLLSIAFAVAQMILFQERVQYRERYNEEKAVRERVESELETASDKLERRTSELDTVRARMNEEVSGLEQKVEERDLQIADLQRNLENESARLEKALEHHRSLDARIESRGEAMEQLERTLAEREGELEEKRETIHEQDEAIRAHRATIDGHEETIAELRQEKETALTGLQDRERQLAELEARGVRIDIGKPMKPIDGALSRVDNEFGVAVLNRGSDDGVEINYEFTVYRDARFIARLYVMDVYPGTSLARVDRELTDLEETPLEVGDRITTRIR